MLGAKDVAVEAVDPLAPARGHVEVSDRVLDVGRHSSPIELRVFVDQVGGRLIAQLPIEADFLELLIKGVGLLQIVRIAKLADQPQATILQLVYQQKSYEGEARDYEFSATSMREHWQSGYEDTRRTLKRQEWMAMPPRGSGVLVHDVHRQQED